MIKEGTYSGWGRGPKKFLKGCPRFGALNFHTTIHCRLTVPSLIPFVAELYADSGDC